MTRVTFDALRGYDEAMKFMGYQDVDLINRAMARGVQIVRSKVPSPTIINRKEDGWDAMNEHNKSIGADTNRTVNPDGFGRGTVTDLSGHKKTPDLSGV